MKKSLCFWSVCLLLLPVAVAAQETQDKGQIIEEVVARVNSEVITRSDLENARKSLHDDARQDCPACTPEQLAAKIEPQEKNDLLRDLIDNSLMVQRGKDMGVNVDADCGQAFGSKFARKTRSTPWRISRRRSRRIRRGLRRFQNPN